MCNWNHLKKLSQVRTNAGVKFFTPAAFPGSHCPLHTTLALASNIRGMSTLVIGTSECGNYSRNVVKAGIGNELHYTYVLDEKEVVFGCRSGIIQAVKTMEAEGATAILLISTCVPEVIGEDMEGIVHEIESQSDIFINFVSVGHFKANSYPSGYWKTLLAFGKMMKPLPQKQNVINILGRSPEEEHIPLPSLLEELIQRGFSLRMIAPKSRIEDFTMAPEARLNLVLSPYMDPIADFMEEKFNIKSIKFHEIYQVSKIDEILDKLSVQLAVNWNNAFEINRQKAICLEEWAKERLQGTSYLLTKDNLLSPLPLIDYLDQFDMTPLLVHMEEFYPGDKDWRKRLLKKEINPFICHMVNEIADKEQLEKVTVDLSIGEIKGASDKIRQMKDTYRLYGQISYERTTELLGNLKKIFER